MFQADNLKYVIAGILILTLLSFTVIIIKPIFISIIFGLVLAYTFFPIHKFLHSKIRNETISAFITCFVVVILLGLFLWFSTPILVNQVFDTYLKIQSFDMITTVKELFPTMFSDPQTLATFNAAYTNFITTTTKATIEKFTNTIMDLPKLVLELLVVLIVFFYGLRDGNKFLEVVKDSLPFDKSTTSRFIQKSKKVTFSVVFGRIVIGIITGALAGIGFYLVGIKSSLLLTYIAMITSILPMVGPWIVWGPVVIGLFISGNTASALFLLVYSLVVVTLFENLSHPIYVSKKSEIPNSLTLIGLIGGMLVFGIIGIIIGPLVVAYLLVLFDLYKEKNIKKQEIKE